MIRLFEPEDDVADDAREEAQARIHAAGAALQRLDELVEEDWSAGVDNGAERIRGSYGFRRDRFRPGSTAVTTARSSRARATSAWLRHGEFLNAERAAVELRRSGVISDGVARRVERDLDLEDARLEI